MSARNDESYLKFWSRRRFTPPCVGIHYSPRMLGCGEMPPVIDWLLCEPNLSKAERKGCARTRNSALAKLTCIFHRKQPVAVLGRVRRKRHTEKCGSGGRLASLSLALTSIRLRQRPGGLVPAPSFEALSHRLGDPARAIASDSRRPSCGTRGRTRSDRRNAAQRRC